MPAGGMALVRESDIRNLNPAKLSEITNFIAFVVRKKKKKGMLTKPTRLPFQVKHKRAFFSRSGRTVELQTVMNPRLQGKLSGLHLQGIGSACRQPTSARC